LEKLKIMNFDVPKKEETFELSRQFIEAVEKSKMDANDKTNLLLIKAGLKPAAEIELLISRKTGDDTQVYLAENELQEAIDLIKKSGLAFKIEERKFVKEIRTFREGPGEPEITKLSTGESIQAFVAGSQEKLDALTKVWNTQDEEAIGLALGIPQSAIESYVGKRNAINLYDLPEDIQNKETAAFLTPTLSKDNQQEEIREGKKRADFIKKICPNLYKELVEREVGE
jgi:hypothetical protein